MFDLIIKAFIYYFPAYLANAGLVFVYDFLGRRLVPVSVKWFGSHRSFDGLLFTILCGGAAGLLVSSFWFGAFLGIGTWLGAMGSSFIKRRLGMETGSSVLLLDHLDFIVGSTLVGSLISPPKLEYFVIIFLLTPFVHRAANTAAYKLELKDNPH